MKALFPPERSIESCEGYFSYTFRLNCCLFIRLYIPGAVSAWICASGESIAAVRARAACAERVLGAPRAAFLALSPSPARFIYIYTYIVCVQGARRPGTLRKFICAHRRRHDTRSILMISCNARVSLCMEANRHCCRYSLQSPSLFVPLYSHSLLFRPFRCTTTNTAH